LRTPADLVARGLASPGTAPDLAAVAARYAIAIPPALADAIAAEGRDGPLARQFLPDPDELRPDGDEHPDPTGDAPHSPIPGVVHRYPDRVLLKPVTVCAVYCRFCFRREQVGPAGANLGHADLDRAIDYIAGRPEIWEVIVTGGDPLVLSPERIRALLERLCAIPHVAVIRFHSRVPIAAPERVNQDLVRALTLGIERQRAIYLALHCNHARELGDAARAALGRLAAAGIPLLAQTVLLAGVNDDAAVLEQLFRALVASRVKPYYLHHLDAAPGTRRFRVPVERGQALMRALRGRLSGLCLPEYVIDIPGGFGKVPIGPVFARPEGGRWRIDDPWGGPHDLER